MSNYTIEIFYKTGNSFGSHEETETTGSFETLEEAKQFLSYLKAHHTFSLKLGNLRLGKAQMDALKESVKQEPWYYENYPEGYFMFNDRQYDAFYIGYFETLLEARIICIGTTELDTVYEPSYH